VIRKVKKVLSSIIELNEVTNN